MPIMNAYLSVDTFFFMAGLLTCYIFMMESDKGRPFKPLRYLAMRYLRLTPALLVCVLFLMYIVMHVTNGPQWGTATKPMADTCRDNWWLTLLYVNNYANFDRLCVSHSWYLSIDMQLAFLAPLMFVPLRRWPRRTALCLCLLTLALCFFTFTKTYLGNYWWTLVLIPLEGVNYDFLAEIYVKTPHRASPYIVGLGIGYIIAKNIRRKPNVNKIWVWLGWLICTVASLVIVYSVGISYAENYEYSAVDAAFYNGPVNAFLSWPGWQPFSRLAYCGYLVHRFFSDIFTTILMASVLYLTLWSVRAPARGTLPCLHGMRALSIAWVILGHRYVMELGIPTVNLRDAYEMVRFDWTAMPIMNAYLSVDTFFFMADRQSPVGKVADSPISPQNDVNSPENNSANKIV
ncbi:hypothetical protein B566_EDAN001765 [Ephemera danica]|nr:hypothetical protein B566_EDAN001765 [Ephemera danica]